MYCTILTLTTSLICSAQSANNNPKKNKDTASYAAYLKAKEEKRKAAVLKYAKDHGIPVSGIDYKGESVFLHHIENNRPVYYKGKDDSVAQPGNKK